MSRFTQFSVLLSCANANAKLRDTFPLFRFISMQNMYLLKLEFRLKKFHMLLWGLERVSASQR